jgi:hypothetical protein
MVLESIGPGHPLPTPQGFSSASPDELKKGLGQVGKAPANGVKRKANGTPANAKKYKSNGHASSTSEEMDAWVDEKLRQLTIEEKAAFLAGVDVWRTLAVPRLGIPQLKVFGLV